MHRALQLVPPNLRRGLSNRKRIRTLRGGALIAAGASPGGVSLETGSQFWSSSAPCSACAYHFWQVIHTSRVCLIAWDQLTTVWNEQRRTRDCKLDALFCKSSKAVSAPISGVVRRQLATVPQSSVAKVGGETATVAELVRSLLHLRLDVCGGVDCVATSRRAESYAVLCVASIVRSPSRGGRSGVGVAAAGRRGGVVGFHAGG
jgi:hypothetical protein